MPEILDKVQIREVEGLLFSLYEVGNMELDLMDAISTDGIEYDLEERIENGITKILEKIDKTRKK